MDIKRKTFLINVIYIIQISDIIISLFSIEALNNVHSYSAFKCLLLYLILAVIASNVFIVYGVLYMVRHDGYMTAQVL